MPQHEDRAPRTDLAREAREPEPAREQSATNSNSKPRSCLVCRQRRVRCDKQAPCGRCRTANIPCVLPATNRPPRWARRLNLNLNPAPLADAATSSVAAAAASSRDASIPPTTDTRGDPVVDRLRTVEHLVRELSSQLQQQAKHPHSPSRTAPVSQVGRMVDGPPAESRYVSSGFWSWIDDELDALKMDTRGTADVPSDISEDGASGSSQENNTSSAPHEPSRTPTESYAFLFRHRLTSPPPATNQHHPLALQVPFLLDVFSENVNSIVHVVHMPSILRMVRDVRSGRLAHFAPNDEALMFSIYYAAVTSMEEDEVKTTFGASKSELGLKYRLELEHALAKADFLDAPNLVLVQAFTIFLLLARRHESPRYMWMMTGLVIRMAVFLGLQRDGTNFEQSKPFDIEMRRRVWWAVCVLDVRASEDQGTDMAIASGSSDTKMPLNINDLDIDPDSKQLPPERRELTDMSGSRIASGIADISRQLAALNAEPTAAGHEAQSRLLDEIYPKFEQEYLQYIAEPGNVLFPAAVAVARIVVAKLTLLTRLPILFSSPSEVCSSEIRIKLLITATELAEYNHLINADQTCRQWRWVYQVHTHWYAVVFLMIEITQRPWSSTVERAFIALHSSWLMPARSRMGKNVRFWVPLRKLMQQVRNHRNDEINRLRSNPQEVARLEMEDLEHSAPLSPHPFTTAPGAQFFRERWRQLVGVQEQPRNNAQTAQVVGGSLEARSMPTAEKASQPLATTFNPLHGVADTSISTSLQLASVGEAEIRDRHAATAMIDIPGKTVGSSSNTTSIQVPTPNLPGVAGSAASGYESWAGESFGDGDALDLEFSHQDEEMLMNDGEMNWYDWTNSARDMEMDTDGSSSYLGGQQW